MARTKEFDRDVVLDRAMRVFWRKGYDAASLQDLVEAMDIGRQSLYDTFGDKHALFLAALDRYGTVHRARMMAPLQEGGPVKPALRQVFADLIEQSIRDGGLGCFAVNATVELAPHDVEIARRVKANFVGAEQMLQQALERARESGEIAAEHDPRALARYLYNAIQGLRVMTKVTTDRDTLEDIARVTLSVLD